MPVDGADGVDERTDFRALVVVVTNYAGETEMTSESNRPYIFIHFLFYFSLTAIWVGCSLWATQ